MFLDDQVLTTFFSSLSLFSTASLASFSASFNLLGIFICGFSDGGKATSRKSLCKCEFNCGFQIEQSI